jgi:hypothetical protein
VKTNKLKSKKYRTSVLKENVIPYMVRKERKVIINLCNERLPLEYVESILLLEYVQNNEVPLATARSVS